MQPTNDNPMTRRLLLRTGVGFGVAALVGCGMVDPGPGPGNGGNNTTDPVTAFKRSGRNRNVSNAAKKHNANHIYASFDAASADPAHPGDRSKVVQITLSRTRFDQLFPNGTLSADLRHV